MPKDIFTEIAKEGEYRNVVDTKRDELRRKQAQELAKFELDLWNKGWRDKDKIAEEAQKRYAKREEQQLNQTLAERKKAAQEELDQRIENLELEYETATTNEERLAARKQLNDAKRTKYLQEQTEKLAQQTVAAAVKAGDSAVEAGLSVYTTYMSGINARMQGTSKTFGGLLSNISRNLTASPYVKQIDVIDNLSKLVSQGIAYNVEQRAFLETISDKIATTFDATNGTLLRLIRIQQADTTAARLGLEADLTRYLNKNYQDTSYLSEQFDNVSAALYEATSIAGRNMGVEIEGVVQKWLGSLYSVGASDTLISTLSQGIGYLGSGNISALSSSESIMNLFALGASRAGVDIGSAITGGLNASQVNKLLSGVVSYIQEIGSTGNLATRSEFASMFGMTISDMTALLNLSSADLVDISNNMLTYSDTISEVQSQLEQVSSRMHFTELIDNVLSNAALTLGMGVASNIVTYGIYRAAELLDVITGDLKIPTISVMGSAIDLDMTYGQAIKTGVLGIGALGTLFNALSSIARSGGLDLSAWGAQDYLTRGGTYTTVAGGVTSTLSSSAFIGSTSSTDIAGQSITSAQGEAQTVAGSPEDTEKSMREEMYSDVSAINSNVSLIYDLLRNMNSSSSPTF